jgi:hypothetical protein
MQINKTDSAKMFRFNLVAPTQYSHMYHHLINLDLHIFHISNLDSLIFFRKRKVKTLLTKKNPFFTGNKISHKKKNL